MQDLHTQWNHRWITNKAQSTSQSVHNLGVIATQDIKKGEPILVYGGISVPKTDIEKYWKIMGHVGIQVEDEFFLVPTTREELEKTGIVNHSCEPNCGFKSSTMLIALRDIKKGEEIFLDYAFCESVHKGFTCNCNSKNCRKIVKPTDWKIPELRKKYGQYFSPYLQKKF